MNLLYLGFLFIWKHSEHGSLRLLFTTDYNPKGTEQNHNYSSILTTQPNLWKIHKELGSKTLSSAKFCNVSFQLDEFEGLSRSVLI